MTTNEDELLVACPTCGCDVHPDQLESHLGEHLVEEPETCPYCGYAGCMGLYDSTLCDN